MSSKLEGVARVNRCYKGKRLKNHGDQCLVGAKNGVKQSSDTLPVLKSALLKSSLELSQNVAQLVAELRETNQCLRESARHTAMLIDELAADLDEDENDSRTYLDGSPRR